MFPLYALRLYDAGGEYRLESTCTYFKLVKDAYIPYVYFEGKFISSSGEIGEYNRVEFWISDMVMHRGTVDEVDVSKVNNRYEINVRSKGFTFLLCQNQPEPGMLTNVSLRNIVFSFSDIPYITCDSSDPINYIYVKENSSVWDAVCNLSFRLNGTYPYIEGTNNVKITIDPPKKTISLEDKDIIYTGVKHDFTKLISHIHMQDIEGNYNVYSKTNLQATQRNIIRHKQVPLDRQFLYDPNEGLDYKLNYSMRGMKYKYIAYAGYNNEDLFDGVILQGSDRKIIHKIELIFNGEFLATELGFYEDGFFMSQG